MPSPLPLFFPSIWLWKQGKSDENRSCKHKVMALLVLYFSAHNLWSKVWIISAFNIISCFLLSVVSVSCLHPSLFCSSENNAFSERYFSLFSVCKLNGSLQSHHSNHQFPREHFCETQERRLGYFLGAMFMLRQNFLLGMNMKLFILKERGKLW
jgi:hypothetical protein